jgi:hypothetical protein
VIRSWLFASATAVAASGILVPHICRFACSERRPVVLPEFRAAATVADTLPVACDALPARSTATML